MITKPLRKITFYLAISASALAFASSIQASLVAYWNLDGATAAERLNESLGQSALDASETGGNSMWNVRTGFGDVLANETSTRYLTVTQHSTISPTTGSFSLSLWSYRTSDSSNPKGIIDFLSPAATSGYQLFYQSNNSLRIRLDDTAGNTINIDTLSSHYSPNTWQNIIVTVDRDTSRARIFINGTEATINGGVNISALNGSIIPDQNLWINILNNTYASLGRMDDIGLFNHVLTPSQIASIQANGGTPLSQIDFSPVSDVTLSPSSGALRPGDTVAITSDNPVDAIYYTLDGSDPDSSSSLYTTPLTLLSGGELKAVAYKNNDISNISSGHYSVIPSTPPNIVLVMADDVGFGDLSCYGAPTIHTPHLDQLARSGTRFTQFTTCGPGDLANQYALLTGRVARRGGLPQSLDTGQTNGLDSREWTLAEALRKSGYQTAFIGAWHLGDTLGSKPEDQGFQLFHGLPYQPATVPAPPLIENGTTIDSPYNPHTLLNQLTQRATAFINAQGTSPFLLVFQPPSLPATGTSLLGSYGDQIEALDASIGQLRASLESANHTSDTLIIFISDEGTDLSPTTSPFGSSGLFKDGKTTTWEGGVRVPAIASWPGVIPSATDNYALLWLPDLYSSITSLVDAYTPDDRPYDGTARAEVLLAGRQQPDDTTTLYLHRHNGTDYQLQSMRQGSWKYHLSYNNSDPQNSFSTSAPLLFHVEFDPTEHINRSSSHSSILATLQQTTTIYQSTFAAPVPQLPVAKPPFLTPPLLSVNFNTTPEGVFQGSIKRPKDSLDEHYQIQYSYNLVNWFTLPVSAYITSVSSQPNNEETVNFSVNLDTPAFSPSPLFFRLSATRP